jgi:hypothetical protein
MNMQNDANEMAKESHHLFESGLKGVVGLTVDTISQRVVGSVLTLSPSPQQAGFVVAVSVPKSSPLYSPYGFWDKAKSFVGLWKIACLPCLCKFRLQSNSFNGSQVSYLCSCGDTVVHCLICIKFTLPEDPKYD